MRENKIVHIISALNFFGMSWYITLALGRENAFVGIIFWITFCIIFIATRPEEEKNERNSKSS